MIFNPTTRTRKVVGSLLAAGILGGTAAGAVAASQSEPPPAPPPKTMPATVATSTVAKSTVPKSLMRAETAAEDVIGFREQGKPAKSKAEARILRDLAHGKAADDLRRAGVSESQIAAFQHRADRTARLSLGGASTLRVSLAANSVSQLMPGFYARYQDPVPPTVLKLDYLDRQVQLDARGGHRAKLRATVRQLDATWQQLRPQLVQAGGVNVAKAYDQHVNALKRGGTATAIQKQAVHGLDIVDQMEGVFLGK